MTLINYDTFFQLVRLGIGTSKDAKIPKEVDWVQLKALADAQGLTAVVLGGIDILGSQSSKSEENLNQNLSNSELTTVPQLSTLNSQLKLEWIGDVLQNYEQRYVQYEKAIGSLAGFYNLHGFKMMVLKGYACSIDWPKPNHRPCGDIDIWLFGKQREADEALNAWFKVQGSKFKIDGSHHHHTVFEWQGFTAENHYDFVNVHAHKSSKELEVIFKELGDASHINDNDNENDSPLQIKRIEQINQEFENSRIVSTSKNAKGTKISSVEVNGEKVYIPSSNLHALFLIKHMVSHFAAAEITLRQVLDWAFFVEKHTKEIDWEWLEELLVKFHMKDFYNCINAICVGDLGFDVKMFPSVQFDPALKDRVLADILSPEWTAAEPRGFLKRMAYKYHRWQGNAWKQELCYPESRFESFLTGLWSHIITPKGA